MEFRLYHCLQWCVIVPDLASRIRDVVLVRRIFSSGKPWGVGILDRGGNGEGIGRGRSVYECFVSSPWRPHIEDKRMVLEHTHGLFIT